MAKKNPDYHPIRQHIRPTLDEERPVERPLCAGLLFGLVNDDWKQVGTAYVKKRQCYDYALLDRRMTGDIPVWQRNAQWIDDAIVRHFKKEVRDTFKSQIWREHIGDLDDAVVHEKKLKQAQLSAHLQAMTNVVAGLETISNVNFIRAAEERYTAMEAEERRLEAEIAALNKQSLQYQKIRSLRDKFEDAIDKWDAMCRDDKHALLQVFIARIEAVDPQRHGGMRLIFYWQDGKHRRNSPEQNAYGRSSLDSGRH